jgi:hypothetical protein
MNRALLAIAIVLLPGVAWAQTAQQKQWEMEDQANHERILNEENARQVQENADRMHQQQERDELESRIGNSNRGNEDAYHRRGGSAPQERPNA